MSGRSKSRGFFRIANVDKYDLVSVLYLWFLALLVGILSSSASAELHLAGEFILGAAILYTFFSLLTYSFAESKKLAASLSLFCFLILALAPLQGTGLSSKGSAILLILYYTVIVVTPAFFTLWSWKLQLLAALIVMFSATFSLSVHFMDEILKFIILTGAACLLSVRLVYLRTKRGRVGRFRVMSSEEESELSHHFRPKFLNVSLFQGGLVLALLILEESFVAQAFSFSESASLKIYALFALLIGNLSAGATQKISPKIVALSTLATVAALLISSLNLNSFHSGSHLILPVLFIGFSTLALGWSFAYQIAFIWVLSLATVFSMCISGQGFLLDSSFLNNLSKSYKDLALILMGLSLSVWFSRKLEVKFRKSRVELPSVDSHLNVESKEVPGFPAFRLVSERLSKHRQSLMLKSLLVLSVISCFISTTLLIGAGSSLMGLALLTLVCSVVGWVLINYSATREDDISGEYIWLGGAVLSGLLILWPAILIANAPKFSQVNHLWILLPLVAIGLVPWRLSELFPILAVSVFCGLEIIGSSDASMELTLYYCAVGLLALLCNVYRTRRLIERDVLETLPLSLSRCSTVREIMLVTLDAHLAYFQSSQGMLQRTEGELELIRNDSLYRIRGEGASLYEIPNSQPDEEYEISKVNMSVCNWNTQLEFFHSEFGLVQEFHGLHFKYPSSSSFLGNNEGGAGVSLGAVSFIPFKLPFLKILRRDDLRLSEQIFLLARMRIDSCIEKENSLKIAEANKVLNKRREFEINALVHDINNTVQDLTVICDSLSEQVDEQGQWISDLSLCQELTKISDVARSMASSVSDAKRKRELESINDLSPRELVEVKECLEDVVNLSKVRADRKSIEIDYSPLSEEVWVRLSAREHLSTVMRNLINNAIQYSDSGAEVKIRAQIENDNIVIEVRDNGPGLSDHDRREIFTAGVRGESGKTVPGGLGVGLAQSRRVVEAGGGSLRVSSQGLGHGSAFLLSLPKASSPNSRDRNWALLVDDQRSVVDFYSRIAKALEFEPETACSLDEAESLILELGEPSFVLTDLHLGKSSGFSVIKSIREKFGEYVPIMVVSGLPEDDVEQKVKKAGANDFLAKPVSRKALLARIESLLNHGNYLNNSKR